MISTSLKMQNCQQSGTIQHLIPQSQPGMLSVKQGSNGSHFHSLWSDPAGGGTHNLLVLGQTRYHSTTDSLEQLYDCISISSVFASIINFNAQHALYRCVSSLLRVQLHGSAKGPTPHQFDRRLTHRDINMGTASGEQLWQRCKTSRPRREGPHLISILI